MNQIAALQERCPVHTGELQSLIRSTRSFSFGLRLQTAISSNVELTVRSVVDDNGRPAAINAGTALVVDLSLYPSNPRQTCNPVGAACLAVIEQVVMKLAPISDCVAIACRRKDTRRPCRSLPKLFGAD